MKRGDVTQAVRHSRGAPFTCVASADLGASWGPTGPFCLMFNPAVKFGLQLSASARSEAQFLKLRPAGCCWLSQHRGRRLETRPKKKHH